MCGQSVYSDTLAHEITLPQIDIKGHREHYSKRNNPAVQLMKRLREDAVKNSPEIQPYYTNRSYNRILIGLDGVSDSIGGKGKTGFINNYIDTLATTGERFLPLSVKEQLSKNYYRKNPRASKRLVYAMRSEGIDDIFDNTNIMTMLNEIVKQVDIFDNNISLLGTRLVSPLSTIGPDFYRYHIGDTVTLSDGTPYATLEFAPRNHASAGFIGRIYYEPDDTVKMISKVDMHVNSTANINFINGLHITQHFARGINGCRLLTRDQLTLSISAIEGMNGLTTVRDIYYTAHDFAKPEGTDILDRADDEYMTADAYLHDDEFWQKQRPRSLVESQSMPDISGMVGQLRQLTFYRIIEKLTSILVTGYIPTGTPSKINIGPVNSLLSFNPIEGARFRVGAHTTPSLNEHIFANGYIAYGTRDQDLKYKGEATYSFTPRKRYALEYPINAISLSYSEDISRPGQIYSFTTPDNIFLSPHWTSDTMALNQQLITLKYTLELPRNLTLAVSAEYSRIKPKANLELSDLTGYDYSHIDQSALTLMVRWAPGEKYYQTPTQRIPANKDGTAISVSHTYGPNRFAGNRFEYNITEIAVKHREWLTPAGHFDAVLKGGAVWSQTPYMALFVPNTNLSYTIQPESFSLIKPYEFIVDRYMSLNLTYHLDGLLFNLIPLNKYLKLRELVSFNTFWGHLTHKNIPSQNNRLPILPTVTQMMNATPYCEISAGIDNIFRFFRIDYVWRLTYRYSQGAPRSGIRFGFHLSF